jgi:hypothetical protein
MWCSIICCYAPTYKALLPSDSFLKRLRKAITMAGSRDQPMNLRPIEHPQQPFNSTHEKQTSQGWLKLENKDNATNKSWVETGPICNSVPIHGESGFELNVINVRQSIEVVK